MVEMKHGRNEKASCPLWAGGQEAWRRHQTKLFRPLAVIDRSDRHTSGRRSLALLSGAPEAQGNVKHLIASYVPDRPHSTESSNLDKEMNNQEQFLLP